MILNARTFFALFSISTGLILLFGGRGKKAEKRGMSAGEQGIDRIEWDDGNAAC